MPNTVPSAENAIVSKIRKVPAFRELTHTWRESGENKQVKFKYISYMYFGRHSVGERGEGLLEKIVGMA